MSLHPLAGKPAPRALLENIPRLVSDYYIHRPDPSIATQRVSFGTSGHRGSSSKVRFNEGHILAITQAICEVRAKQDIKGPLYLGMDTHALSEPAFCSALEVLAAHGVTVMIQQGRSYTPTPVISHAILNHNKRKDAPRADGIIITPSHNPPADGGFKYNPPHGGPADSETTRIIQERANELLAEGLDTIKRIPFQRAQKADTTHAYDYLTPYISELDQVLDLEAIANADLHIGVDPLGGSGVHYWEPIAERYKLNLHVVNPHVDPTFSFMSVDKDGKIRMDCSSPYAMASLIALKDRFDIAFGNDPDFDRHGIVTKSAGLMNPNHYLSVAAWYLFQHRPQWSKDAAIGKTLVSSSMLDRVATHLGRRLHEVPVGFKWFVDGLLHGTCGFGGEESAGASFLRLDGSPWSTDKDGIILALLSAEITAKTGKDPGTLYQELEAQFGSPSYQRLDLPITPEKKAAFKTLTPESITQDEMAGEPILAKLTHAPGNNAPIGGIKVVTENGWFAARPSGTEDIYKIYTESFLGDAHLQHIQQDAQTIVDTAFREK